MYTNNTHTRENVCKAVASPLVCHWSQVRTDHLTSFFHFPFGSSTRVRTIASQSSPLVENCIPVGLSPPGPVPFLCCGFPVTLPLDLEAPTRHTEDWVPRPAKAFCCSPASEKSPLCTWQPGRALFFPCGWSLKRGPVLPRFLKLTPQVLPREQKLAAVWETTAPAIPEQEP